MAMGLNIRRSIDRMYSSDRERYSRRLTGTAVAAIALTLAGTALLPSQAQAVVIAPCASNNDVQIDFDISIGLGGIDVSAGTDLCDNTVGSAEIIDNSITANDIAANAVGASELADNAVDTAAIQDGAVTTAKIGDGAVTTAKLADDAVTSAKILDNTITAADIATNAITADELADNAVDTAAIQDGAVTEPKLANNAVSTRTIQDGAVTETKLADGSVSTSKIQDYAVTEVKLADNSVSTRTIQDGAVTMNKLGDDVIGRFQSIEDDVDNAFGGVALAMAMSNIPTLSTGKNFSFGVATGVYEGGVGFAVGANARFSDNVVGRLSGGGTDEGKFGGGGGLAFEF